MQAGVKAYGLRGYYVLSPDGPLPFSNRQFDAVWCDSVIEHVTVDRAKCASIPNTEFIRLAELHQAAFAKEISRVGKSYFVQTPYKHFPVEAHAWLPFVQYLPLPVRHRFSRITRAIWIKQWSGGFHLYDLRRFRRDFADATEIVFERVPGFPKALIAIRK